MRRLTLTIALICGFALIAAACSDDADESTEVSSSDPADDTTADDSASGDTGADTPTSEEAPPAEPLGAGPYPIADLTIVVDLGDGTGAEYRLACLGDTATFTGAAGDLDAAAACLSLTEAEVRNRLTTDQHAERICTEIYGGPEVAEISGTLDDQPVSTTIDRANGCGIDDWERLLASILPPAAG